MKPSELTEDNLFIFAAKHYHNPLGVDADEFHEDLKRFKYVKRLVNRYIDSDKLSERLILNHLIVIFNMFGIDGGLAILKLKFNDVHWPVLKPFLIFLKIIKNDDMFFVEIPQDPVIVDELRKINVNY